MQIRPELALQAVLKSLTEVIAPSVDPHDKMAQEQVSIVIGLLTLISDRLPHTHAYDCDELGRLVYLAQDIAQAADSEALSFTLDRGIVVLERAKASPGDIVAAIAALRSAIGEIAAGLASRKDAIGRAAVRALLDASSTQLLRERSWVLMQGWENDPSTVPEIEALIAGTGE
ncbi:hypothetical protein [Sphingosinicella soli]|uniref:Uncharacterized protein n=1 Tax=Sphingosinicella soli TaxID=333708 RepID=A0A7W7B3J0_9SPHN|nr:hypothetical protein [Sphingosinicella soli]MBB4633301.1 hypothetical protein [Sphingosinicella soli]